MSTSMDALAIRRALGRDRYGLPTPHGPDGWSYRSHDGGHTIVIVTCAAYPEDDGREWLHASISHPAADPTYAELVTLHAAIYGDGFAVQMFVPSAEHVNIHPHALHLWGRLDGSRFVPIRTDRGTI